MNVPLTPKELEELPTDTKIKISWIGSKFFYPYTISWEFDKLWVKSNLSPVRTLIDINNVGDNVISNVLIILDE